MSLVRYRMGSSSLPSGFLVFRGRREFAVWPAFLCLVSKCLVVPADVCVVGPVITRGLRASMATMRPVPWPLSSGDLHIVKLFLQVCHHFFHCPQLFCCLRLRCWCLDRGDVVGSFEHQISGIGQVVQCGGSGHWSNYL